MKHHDFDAIRTRGIYEPEGPQNVKRSTSAHFPMMAVSPPQAIHGAVGNSHLISGRPRLREGIMSKLDCRPGVTAQRPAIEDQDCWAATLAAH